MLANKQVLQRLSGRFRQRWEGKGVSAVLARGAGGSFVVKVLGTGIALGVHILLARLLGAANYGDYIYVLTWMSLLALLSKLGLDTTSLRFVAAYHGREDWGLLRGFLQRSQQVAIASSVLTALAAGGVVWLLRGHLRAEFVAVFWIACLLLPVSVLLQISASCLQALKRVVWARTLQEVLPPLLLAGGVFLLIGVLGQPGSASLALAVNFMAVLIALILASRLLQRFLPPLLHTARYEYQTKEWGRVAIPLLLISGFYLVLTHTDILMIGAFLGTTNAGYYAVASRVATLTLFGLMSVNVIAAPMISELYTQGRMKDLQGIVTLSARGICAFALPVSLCLIIWGKWVLGLFGSGFSEAYLALVILTVGQLVNALAGSVGLLMTMTGHQNDAAYVLGCCAALNVLLNAILIPTMGIGGAAFATAITTVLWNVALFIYVKKRVRITSGVFAMVGHVG